MHIIHIKNFRIENDYFFDVSVKILMVSHISSIFFFFLMEIF